jgi:hypothetical protein
MPHRARFRSAMRFPARAGPKPLRLSAAAIAVIFDSSQALPMSALLVATAAAASLSLRKVT